MAAARAWKSGTAGFTFADGGAIVAAADGAATDLGGGGGMAGVLEGAGAEASGVEAGAAGGLRGGNVIVRNTIGCHAGGCGCTQLSATLLAGACSHNASRNSGAYTPGGRLAAIAPSTRSSGATRMPKRAIM